MEKYGFFVHVTLLDVEASHSQTRDHLPGGTVEPPPKS